MRTTTRPVLGAIAYLIVGACVTYLVWNRYDGVAWWPFSWPFVAALAVAHVLAGYLIVRWWALALPLGWAALSLGAEGYDTPVAILIAFQTPFLWLPALAVGVVAARARRSRNAGRSG